MASKSITITSKTNDNDIAYYIEDQPSDAQIRYKEKLKYAHGEKTLPDPYRLTKGWQNDLTLWPDVTYGDIYNYLIDSPGIYTKQSLKAFKSLDAYKYLQAGHVQPVYYHTVSEESPFCFLKAKVIPSQRVREKPHEPWVCVGKATGDIYCAHCTCMAGLGEVCSHVASVLFKVQTAVTLGLTTKSSTSIICQWNQAFRKEIEPTPVSEMQELLKGKRTKHVEAVIPSGKDEVPSKEVLQSLKDILPCAAFFTTIPPLQTTEHAGSVATKEKGIDNMPPTLTSHRDKPATEWDTYHVTEEQALNLEKVTNSQTSCDRWFEHRHGRITASKAHDVLVRRDTTCTDNLVKNIMGYKSYNLEKNKAIRWGVDNEDKAREKYVNASTTFHTDVQCQTTGLLIDHASPFLGASADGVRKCSCCGQETVEIKCPYKHRFNLLPNAAKEDKDFCLTTDLKLKESHRYFTQVQVQMHVHRVQFCGLVILQRTGGKV